MEPPRGLVEIVAFYGDPRLWVREDGSAHPAWESQMVSVALPLPLPLGWNPEQKASRVRVHNKIAPLVEETFQAVVDEGAWPLLYSFDGAYTWRVQRGSHKLSMHAFGGALDFNARTNRLGDTPTMPRELVRIFTARGWTWGGQWKRPDGMHFQWAKGY